MADKPDLQDFEDAQLSASFAAQSWSEPPAALDAAILQAARAELAATSPVASASTAIRADAASSAAADTLPRPRWRTWPRPRWLAPFSLAASVALAVGLAWKIEHSGQGGVDSYAAAPGFSMNYVEESKPAVADAPSAGTPLFAPPPADAVATPPMPPAPKVRVQESRAMPAPM
ncbi:hypothetical protein, partial [Chitinimonas sp.]|uniref:hypothetical protein n=1 Tax=Chitinimonas sp. TaxID=1934313 RepID=UPI0035B45FC2